MNIKSCESVPGTGIAKFKLWEQKTVYSILWPVHHTNEYSVNENNCVMFHLDIEFH